VTSTYERLWAVVRRIPRGRVATYGQVAALAGFARQPRLAGYALHALPDASDVPWHRVVNSRGQVSLPESDGRAALQRALLANENVHFAAARVDLARYGWRPRAPLTGTRRGTRSERGRTRAPRRA
jgi:methylated-DNA-protein-cysteine methyltransferase-like protein